MRCHVFLTAFWHSAEDARTKGEGPFGIKAWYATVTRLFAPTHTFLACGSWSDPASSPLPSTVPVINSGVSFTRGYDHRYWMYDGCAYMAAMAYALNRRDWDLLLALDNDVLVGAVDFPALLSEFMARPEVLLTPSWCGRPGGPFHALKREGAVRWLHMRRRGNLIEEPTDPEPQLIEEELRDIFKGHWWNPWPGIETMRQDYGQSNPSPRDRPLKQHWPFVRLPDPAMVDSYRATEGVKAKPLHA